SIALLRGAADPAPEGFDAVEHVSASLAAVPWGHEVEVVLDLPLEEARRRLPSTLATMAETGEGTLLLMQVGSLAWMAGVLGGRPSRPRRQLRDPPPGRVTPPRQRARAAPSRSGPAAAAIAGSPTRVASMIQFVSHVLPASGENACSQRGVSVSVRDQV